MKFLSRGGLDLIAEVFGDAPSLRWPKASASRILLHRVALPFGAREEEGEGVVAGVVLLVRDQEIDQLGDRLCIREAEQRTLVT